MQTETTQSINKLEGLLATAALLEETVLTVCKSDFLSFVRLVAPTLVSDWKMGQHIKVISQKLQAMEEGKIKRLMVFLPPRSSKSVTCSKLFPAWYIGRHPEHEILTVSHSDQLSSDFGRSVRDIVNTEYFRKYSVVLNYAVMCELLANGRQTTTAHTMQRGFVVR